jgi:predicted amidophosphoribosyltransferase
MTQICRGIRLNDPVDVREIVVQRHSMEAAHTSQVRPTVEELVSSYEIDEACCQPPPKAIGIVDDVLTAGTHYRAVYTVLRRRFPQAPIIGFFIARRVFPTDEAARWFADLNG